MAAPDLVGETAGDESSGPGDRQLYLPFGRPAGRPAGDGQSPRRLGPDLRLGPPRKPDEPDKPDEVIPDPPDDDDEDDDADEPDSEEEDT